jgi:hypothetical protein
MWITVWRNLTRVILIGIFHSFLQPLVSSPHFTLHYYPLTPKQPRAFDMVSLNKLRTNQQLAEINKHEDAVKLLAISDTEG